jgi:hypothetical protein
MAIRKIIKRATDALFTNTEFDGTEATRMVKGTTGQRASAEAGDLRFNTTTNLMEYYDGSQWKSIDSPPTISSISPTVETDANADIVITGSNFQSGATVKFVGDDGTEYASPTVTIDSGTQITATTPSTALSVANEPYDVVVTNVSGLSGTLADALDAGGVPTFNESAGSLGTFYDTGTPSRTGISVDAGATDPDGDTITYSLASGDSLPAGLSLNTSTGEISGDADAVGSETTTTFTIEAATASDTSTRQFSITIKAPVIQEFTSVTSGSFSVPSGITTVDVLVVAGGGAGGGAYHGAGGGAGGLIYRPAFPVTPGGSVPYNVGGGGASSNDGSLPSPSLGDNGQNSTFGGLTALGGGRAATNNGDAQPGGSGGGGSQGHYSPSNSLGTQPQQPGDSGTYGFGNPGGTVPSTSWISGAGGGGAGGAGADGNGDNAPGQYLGGAGGVGKQYDISGSQVYYAGGGSGCNTNVSQSDVAGGQGGGGYGSATRSPQADGVTNRGGGGGGAERGSPGSNWYRGGSGGSGIVIVKY